MPLLFSMPDYLTTVSAELQALFCFFLGKTGLRLRHFGRIGRSQWIVFDQKPMRMDALT